MRTLSAATLVFLGGFAVMVLEIIGARYLAKDFGGSFYVWVSQIGVILIALALGYYIGGALDNLDRYDTIFVDSITAMSRLSFRWSEQQPECFSARGVKDTRGMRANITQNCR